ncbi:outer membrane beta-barrel protein [Proteus myxofaciens]|uniref:Attachment-invasion locus protein n=1 Tax=Proteus myxofaciens ATCC 19692 TaxID=1354337 RepID=A0A198G1F7_9GAMM|nr:outer membrane beta-barrel protein [Proteus myxofaciens]OAT30151.1 attachment-invasion locus protein [Proteus myxofaciens ATCC 19692]
MPIKYFIFLSSSLLFSSPLFSKDDDRLLSLGYASVHVKGSPALNGINARIQSNTNSKNFALQISTIIAQKSFSNHQRLRYASVSMGPVYAITPYFDLYASLGVSYISFRVVTPTQIDNSSKSPSWGTGATFTLGKNIALTFGYEGGYYKIDGKSLPSYAFIGNIGYRF